MLNDDEMIPVAGVLESCPKPILSATPRQKVERVARIGGKPAIEAGTQAARELDRINRY